ncbi:MAG: DUF6789 family protein [Candidatus Paceibacterota bacterium]
MNNTLRSGAYAGVIAALAFGVIMLATSPATIGMIASLYGASGTVAGFIIHLVHGALIGGLFGFLVSPDLSKTMSAVYGLLYGAIWWVLGPILIMPTWLGAGPRLSGSGIQEALPSLPGHLVFGLVLGLLFIAFNVVPEAHEEVVDHENVNNKQ